MADPTIRNSARHLIIPALGGIYASLSEGAETLLRVVAGLALVTHGAGKIGNPFGAAGMVEGLGFYPGALWSLMLTLTEFVGGFLIAIGFLTRPRYSSSSSFGAAIGIRSTPSLARRSERSRPPVRASRDNASIAR